MQALSRSVNPGNYPPKRLKRVDKEYGKDTIQIHKDALDDVVLLHDDLLALVEQ